MVEYGENDSLNYVTLSLKKYNELYDKAKMLDELKAKCGNDLEGYIEKAFDVEKCKEDEGEHIPTIDSNFYNDTSKEQRNTFKVGDKVKGTAKAKDYIVTNPDYIGIVTDVKDDLIVLDGKYTVEARCFEKINESEGN